MEITVADGANLDSFQRLRVSNPYTLFDSKQIFDNAPLFWDDQETAGSGTDSTHSVNHAESHMSVSANTEGTRVRQTFQRFNYQPGKSMLGMFTFSDFETTAGQTKRVGYFDENNGLFLQSKDGELSVVRRTNYTGTPTDYEVPRSKWKLDYINYNGKTGINLNPANSQIFLIDFEWLGVGRVRFAFVIDGKIYYFHEFLNANNNPGVYMSTPNLPVRYELSNDGNGAAATFNHVCSSVISEGGVQDTGLLRYASTGGTHMSTAAENVIYAVLGIRLKSASIGATVKIINTALQIHTASSELEWILKFNPTVAGTFTYANQTNSGVQIAKGATANTVTGGYDISGGFIESGGASVGANGSTSTSLNNALLLGSAIDGTVDEMVLCVRPVAGTTAVDVEGSITWRELV